MIGKRSFRFLIVNIIIFVFIPSNIIGISLILLDRILFFQKIFFYDVGVIVGLGCYYSFRKILTLWCGDNE